MSDLLRIVNVSKSYTNSSIKKKVLSSINISIKSGCIAALIGDSGSGKTTIARLIIGLEHTDTGDIFLGSKKLDTLKKRDFDDCASIQYIFQDPYAAMEENSSVLEVINEPKIICKRRRRNTFDISDALKLVGLDINEFGKRKINSLSGGQRQKLCIARALITRPKIIIADECTSMLDEKSKKEINSIFRYVNKRFGITFLVITHDIYVINNLCDEIFVINEGKLVEFGEKNEIIQFPKHDYTIAYMNSMKRIEGGF